MDSPESQVRLARLKEICKYIDAGQQIAETLKTDGWVNHIGPFLHKMIIDVVGGFENGRYHNGALDDKRLGESRLQVLCAYKRALTDFSSYIYQYIDMLPDYQREYQEIIREEKSDISEYGQVTTDYEEGKTNEKRQSTV